jgi:hypothetical protein
MSIRNLIAMLYLEGKNIFYCTTNMAFLLTVFGLTNSKFSGEEFSKNFPQKLLVFVLLLFDRKRG